MSEEHSALLHEVIAAARKAGADAAEAVVSERQALSVTTRLGELEEVEREESRDLGLRVFMGRRQATVSASDLSPATRSRLVERAVAMAKLAPEDPYAGLAPEELLARGPHPDLDLYDPTELSPEQMEAQALAAEAAARAVQGVSNSDGASSSWSTGAWRLVTSTGFEGAHRGSAFSLSASVIASDENGMERAGEGRTARNLGDLPSAEAIGRDAGERAVKRLGARKIASCTAPVIIENRIAAGMLSALVGAISGPAVARGTSFLKDKLGQRVFAPGFQVVDDPFRPRGLSSAPFDDEGVRVEKRSIIEDGVLTTWLLNCSAAAQLGMTSTGHATRGLAGPPGVSTHNLHVTPGKLDLSGLMRDAGSGLLVTAMFGPSLNANTGDWSAGVSGYWFEGGEPAYPVTEITIAGNLVDVYGRLIPGSDLEFRGSTNSPSLMADAIAIAGR
ncbi:TldD/PmbA family protein [Caulobacter sp. 17J80-11]|uniref:TldD/PmbA family protein n=1 Tax=Caulobacter sp. 17J80-11 TaxID=2763502 RepID=UPI0016535444|nr:TldD/PmbA family protein [Caulobacter sp. 17J80-11]MBC6981040.1 TldD/PmbA family protein [Caulobacter sp. 17J80-11]